MLWNYLKDCSDFYNPVMDIKASPTPGGDESSFLTVELSN